MDTKLHVGRPNLGDRDSFLRRVNEALDSRWLTNNGPFTREFENAISDMIGVRHVVAMCNATVALEIASRALGFTGEVIVPSYTFVATAHALQWQGITPVFADIDPLTHNIDPKRIEELITPRTTGILGVHVWGRPCDTEAIESIARRHNLPVMYDAAHAFACSHEGRMIGAFGSCEIFSFHGTKFINSFEGGAVTTDNDELAEKMRLMRNFGFSGFDNVIHLGVNGKMNEICAAMGLTNLEAIEEIVSVNRRNYESYRSGLEGLPGISLIAYDPSQRNNYQYVVIEIEPDQSRHNRDEVIAALHEKDVIARKYFWPGCHRMEPYRASQPEAWRNLPETERIAARLIVLPTGQSVDEKAIGWICKLIADLVR
ncbi:MAG: aminotransferase class I/II-fold pyridoxal phosphate-dependent enzyme [Verrucomicrobiae bacterium]|nr:aminotransferase class I/II-fold pyridoxal phosphate-dependent enzyme [Verrucomicrobiae bacterium]